MKYKQNGTVVYTSTIAPTYPLLVDTSLYSNGATINNVVISSGGTTTDLRWMVSDQLGTPRMIFDKTGSLASMTRHDYLPFGEELYANSGLRTTTQGYTAAGYSASDKARHKFTEQERDDETGMDFQLVGSSWSFRCSGMNIHFAFHSVSGILALARPAGSFHFGALCAGRKPLKHQANTVRVFRAPDGRDTDFWPLNWSDLRID